MPDETFTSLPGSSIPAATCDQVLAAASADVKTFAAGTAASPTTFVCSGEQDEEENFITHLRIMMRQFVP
jgi:hypothetical protein